MSMHSKYLQIRFFEAYSSTWKYFSGPKKVLETMLKDMWNNFDPINPRVAKLASAEDSKSSDSPNREGSSPSSGTNIFRDLAWELSIYHIAANHCPRVRGLFCRICSLLEKAEKCQKKN